MLFQANMRLALSELESWGFRDAILPFLLYFAILFAVLQKIALFKDEKGEADRKINGVLSFVISAMIVVPHVLGIYTKTQDPVLIMYKILPTSTILIVGLAMTALLMGLVDWKPPAPLMLMIGLGAIGIILYIIVSNMFPTLGWRINMTPQLQALMIVILVFGLVVYFIVRSPLTEEQKKSKKPYQMLKDLFGIER